MDARCAPKRILHAHLPDQRTEVRFDLRPPSLEAGFPTPIAAKTGPVPPHECFRSDDRDDLQDRRKPSIQLDQEPAVVVREPDPAMHLAPQNDQLMSEHRILCLKPAFRLEWRDQNGQDEAAQSEHDPVRLGDSGCLAIRMRFSIHTGYVVGRRRPGHGTGKVGREVYRESGRLWLAHFRRLAGRLLLSGRAEPVDRQWWGRNSFVVLGMCRDVQKQIRGHRRWPSRRKIREQIIGLSHDMPNDFCRQHDVRIFGMHVAQIDGMARL